MNPSLHTFINYQSAIILINDLHTYKIIQVLLITLSFEMQLLSYKCDTYSTFFRWLLHIQNSNIAEKTKVEVEKLHVFYASLLIRGISKITQ